MEQKFQSSLWCNLPKTAHDRIRMSVEVPARTKFHFSLVMYHGVLIMEVNNVIV